MNRRSFGELVCTTVFFAAVLFPAGLRAGEIKEVAIIGNSICSHGAAPALGWYNNCGMAATSPDKDYVHLLYKKICDKLAASQKKQPKLILPHPIIERDFSRCDPAPTANSDIIIVQLGDNYRNPLTVEKFQVPYAAMLRALKGNRHPIIICVSNWDGGTMARMIQRAASMEKVSFVDMGPISSNPRNRAKSEGHFTHGGVNWHPGDRGMAAIANAIWNVLEPKLMKKTSSTQK